MPCLKGSCDGPLNCYGRGYCRHLEFAKLADFIKPERLEDLAFKRFLVRVLQPVPVYKRNDGQWV